MSSCASSCLIVSKRHSHHDQQADGRKLKRPDVGGQRGYVRYHRDHAQEQRASPRNPHDDPVQVFLGGASRPDARYEPAVALQALRQVLLPEHDECVEEGERHHQQEAEEVVEEPRGIEEALHEVGCPAHERRARGVNEVAGDHAREYHD